MKVRSFFAMMTVGAVLCASAPLMSLAAESAESPDLTLSGLFSQEELQERGHIALTESFRDNLYMVEYENADDTRTVYSFSAPVKYQTEDGDTAYIDTSLERANILERLRGFSYKNRTNAFEVYFPRKSSGSLLTKGSSFAIEQRICVGDEGTTRSGAYAGLHNVAYASQEEDGVTYSYSSTAGGSRGEICFSALPETQTVKVAVKGDDITSLTEEESVVSVHTAKGTAMTFVGAGLYDADGRWVQDGSVSLSQEGETYYICYELDSREISDEAVYPLTFSYFSNVTVDTTDDTVYNKVAVASSSDANISNSSCVINDTVVQEAYPTNNYSSTSVLSLRSGVGIRNRIYVKFNLSPLSGIRYDRILSAQYSMTQYYNYTYTAGEHFDMEIHQVAESYDISTVTWNTQPAYYDDLIAGCSIVPQHNEETGEDERIVRYDFSFTTLVQGWLQGISNNGVVFTVRNDSQTLSGYRRFPGSAFVGSDIGPVLAVTYTSDTSSSDNIGIESNAQYYIKCKGSVTGTTDAAEPLYVTAPSASSGTVTLQPFAASSAQKWTMVPYGSSGYYYLRPANLSSYVLYTPNAASYYATKLNTPAGSSLQLFKFQRNWDGSYHIVSSASDDECGLWAAQAVSGQSVYHGLTEVNMRFLDDWTLERVSKGTASVFCVDANAHYNQGGECLDTKQYVNGNKGFNPQVGDYGPRITSSGYTLAVRANQSASTGKSALKTSDLWIYSAHGGKSGLWFSTTSANSCLVTSSSQWAGYENKAVLDYDKGELSSLRYAMLHACSAGADDTVDGTTYSLAGTLYYEGAHFVQAYANDTSTLVGDWMQFFWKAVEDGDTIAEAMVYADDAMWEKQEDEGTEYFTEMSWALFNRVILGDTAMCLNPKA